jgi:hypothetical protein
VIMQVNPGHLRFECDINYIMKHVPDIFLTALTYIIVLVFVHVTFTRLIYNLSKIDQE